jgi:hypothetical protein
MNNISTLVSDLANYVNHDGCERKDFSVWIGEFSPVFELKIPATKNIETLNLLLAGDDPEEQDVDSLANNINLEKGNGADHIYPKLVQLVWLTKHDSKT